jgi:hypothetical protein
MAGGKIFGVISTSRVKNIHQSICINIQMRTITEHQGLMASAHQMVSCLSLVNEDDEIQPTTETSTI